MTTLHYRLYFIHHLDRFYLMRSSCNRRQIQFCMVRVVHGNFHCLILRRPIDIIPWAKPPTFEAQAAHCSVQPGCTETVTLIKMSAMQQGEICKHSMTLPKNWLHAECSEEPERSNQVVTCNYTLFTALASFCKVASCSLRSLNNETRRQDPFGGCKVAVSLLECGQLTDLFSRSFLLGSLLDSLAFGGLNPSFHHKEARHRSHHRHPYCQNALDVFVTSHRAIQDPKNAIFGVAIFQYVAEHDASHSRYDEANEAHQHNEAPYGLGCNAVDLSA